MNKIGVTTGNFQGTRIFATVTILLCVALAIPLWSAAPDARTVMEGVYEQDKSHDMTIRANLDIFGKDGKGQKKKFVLKRLGGLGDSKTLLMFTDPAEIKGVTLLSIIHKGDPDRHGFIRRRLNACEASHRESGPSRSRGAISRMKILQSECWTTLRTRC